MDKKYFSNGVVCGVFTGLDHFCESFPLDPKSKKDETDINNLYNYLDQMRIPTSEIKIANRGKIQSDYFFQFDCSNYFSCLNVPWK